MIDDVAPATGPRREIGGRTNGRDSPPAAHTDGGPHACSRGGSLEPVSGGAHGPCEVLERHRGFALKTGCVPEPGQAPNNAVPRRPAELSWGLSSRYAAAEAQLRSPRPSRVVLGTILRHAVAVGDGVFGSTLASQPLGYWTHRQVPATPIASSAVMASRLVV